MEFQYNQDQENVDTVNFSELKIDSENKSSINTNIIIDNNHDLVKKKKSGWKLFGWIILLIVLYGVGNIIYGNLFKGTYTYEDAGKAVFSIKYPKKYYLKIDKSEGYNNPLVDDVTFSHKCNIFEPIFDCGYDMTLQLVIIKKGNEGFFNNYQDYYKNLDKQKNNLNLINSQCNFEQDGLNQICYIDNLNSSGILFNNNYMIKVLNNSYKSSKRDVQDILSSLTFK